VENKFEYYKRNGVTQTKAFYYVLRYGFDHKEELMKPQGYRTHLRGFKNVIVTVDNMEQEFFE
jgi:hypothetical protein